jgi:hypothetical protein
MLLAAEPCKPTLPLAVSAEIETLALETFVAPEADAEKGTEPEKVVRSFPFGNVSTAGG